MIISRLWLTDLDEASPTPKGWVRMKFLIVQVVIVGITAVIFKRLRKKLLYAQ